MMTLPKMKGTQPRLRRGESRKTYAKRVVAFVDANHYRNMLQWAARDGAALRALPERERLAVVHAVAAAAGVELGMVRRG
jgi:hypothetical protein